MQLSMNIHIYFANFFFNFWFNSEILIVPVGMVKGCAWHCRVTLKAFLCWCAVKKLRTHSLTVEWQFHVDCKMIECIKLTVCSEVCYILVDDFTLCTYQLYWFLRQKNNWIYITHLLFNISLYQFTQTVSFSFLWTSCNSGSLWKVLVAVGHNRLCCD